MTGKSSTEKEVATIKNRNTEDIIEQIKAAIMELTPQQCKVAFEIIKTLR